MKKLAFSKEIIWFNGIVAAVAVLALVGWVTGVRFLTSFRETYFPMPPSTCVGMLLTGGSLMAVAFFRENKAVTLAARILSLTLIAFTLLILFEFTEGISPGIEERLFGISGDINGIPVGRMSPLAALFFAVSNMALLNISLGGARVVYRNLGALLGLVVFVAGFLTTTGYLYGTPLLYGGTTRPIAPAAGFCFALLGAAIILAAGAKAWPLRHFVGSHVQARLLRTFLPIVALFILVDGWLTVVIPEYFDVNPVYLSAVLALVSLIPATYLILGFSIRIGGEIDRANEEREKAQAELKETLAALERSHTELQRSNEELQSFAYVASHDLQEPLRMVSSFMQLIEKRYADKLDDEAREFIDYAVQGANRMRDLINDLLQLSRVGTHGKEFVRVSMEEALHAAEMNLKLAIEDSGATITHDNLPEVDGDFPQLVQLFQNLLENAIKFRSDEPPRIRVTSYQRDGATEFCVRDNSIGFDPEFAERIFVIFQRLHGRDAYGGTGIGLAVVKKIVERHGGRVWATSEPGKGATFCFTVPAR
jgi:signal transduction histidine kinase